MLVKEWMTPEVVTITPDESMMKVSKLMKDNNIRRVPVVDGANKVIGIVSDRDIKEASPSKATTLDVHELYYLLSEIKVKEIMTSDPVCVKPWETVEKAAVVMESRHIGGLPVVDDEDLLVGIITDSDVFRVLIDITRVSEGGVQMGFDLPRTVGALKPILDDITAAGATIISVITVYPSGVDKRNAYIRIKEMEKGEMKKLKADLEAKHGLLYFVQDAVGSLV
jgi:acetoin utilization protein AcuB